MIFYSDCFSFLSADYLNITACRTYQRLGGLFVVLACAYPVRGDGVMRGSCERIVAKEPEKKRFGKGFFIRLIRDKILLLY